MTDEADVHFGISLFKEAMLDDNLMTQVDAVRRLTAISAFIGSEATRNELIPIINDVIDLMNDEVLLNLAEQLEVFIPLVGGFDYANIILNLLVKLSYIDEPLVRDRAAQSMKTICNGMTIEQCEQSFYPLIEEMVTNDWFSSKCSVCPLFSIIYTRMSQEKQEDLRNLYRVLVQDESPIVRRCAASGLIEFIQVIEPEQIKIEFIPIFDNLSKDDQETVRVLAIEVGIAIAAKIQPYINEFLILQTFSALNTDTSWKVRQKVAEFVDQIQTYCGNSQNLEDILIIFRNCIRDSEAEVRIIAAKNVFKFSCSIQKSFDNEEKFEKYFQEQIMGEIQYLITDENPSVRLGLSTNILSFSSLLSNNCFNINILPIVLDALENEESMPFKENMLKNLNSLPSSVDISKAFKSVHSVIRNLLQHSQLHWRTRRNVLIAFLHIAKNSDQDFFNENIQIFFVDLLNDSVFAIRRTACSIFPIFIKLFNLNWAQSSAVRIIQNLAENDRYLIRHIALICIKELLTPSLDINEKQYLIDLKNFKEPQKMLGRILELNRLLLEKLQGVEIDFKDIIKEKIAMFAEDTLITLKKCNDKKLFSIEHDEDYLEKILIVFNRNFTEIVKGLMQDPVINIREQAQDTFIKLRNLCEKIDEEKNQQDYIQNYLNELNEDFWIEIRKEVNEKLKKELEIEQDLNLELTHETEYEIIDNSTDTNVEVTEN